MTTPAGQIHQAYNPMPNLASVVVDEDGLLTTAWYRFFLQIWMRTGGGSTPLGSIPYILIDPNTGAVEVIDPISGAVLATLVTLAEIQPLLDVEPQLLVLAGASAPAAAVPQVVGASPWTFTSLASGTLVVESGQVELGRNGAFVVCGMTGAAVPVLKGDQVRVTYYQSAPVVTLLPLVSA